MTTVLITRAGTGIGRLGAITLAAQGHTVYATMRDPEGRNADRARDLRGHDGDIRIVELDVLSQESADRALRTVLDETDGIDVLVNNAAHLYFSGRRLCSFET